MRAGISAGAGESCCTTGPGLTACYVHDMTMPARQPATYDDIVALPEHQVGEIVDGELFVSPRPAIPHAMGASALGATLDVVSAEPYEAVTVDLKRIGGR